MKITRATAVVLVILALIAVGIATTSILSRSQPGVPTLPGPIHSPSSSTTPSDHYNASGASASTTAQSAYVPAAGNATVQNVSVTIEPGPLLLTSPAYKNGTVSIRVVDIRGERLPLDVTATTSWGGNLDNPEVVCNSGPCGTEDPNLAGGSYSYSWNTGTPSGTDPTVTITAF